MSTRRGDHLQLLPGDPIAVFASRYALNHVPGKVGSLGPVGVPNRAVCPVMASALPFHSPLGPSCAWGNTRPTSRISVIYWVRGELKLQKQNTEISQTLGRVAPIGWLWHLLMVVVVVVVHRRASDG